MLCWQWNTEQYFSYALALEKTAIRCFRIYYFHPPKPIRGQIRDFLNCSVAPLFTTWRISFLKSSIWRWSLPTRVWLSQQFFRISCVTFLLSDQKVNTWFQLPAIIYDTRFVYQSSIRIDRLTVKLLQVNVWLKFYRFEPLSDKKMGFIL